MGEKVVSLKLVRSKKSDNSLKENEVYQIIEDVVKLQRYKYEKLLEVGFNEAQAIELSKSVFAK